MLISGSLEFIDFYLTVVIQSFYTTIRALNTYFMWSDLILQTSMHILHTLHTLKTKGLKFDNSVATGDTISCCIDKLWCHHAVMTMLSNWWSFVFSEYMTLGVTKNIPHPIVTLFCHNYVAKLHHIIHHRFRKHLSNSLGGSFCHVNPISMG